MTYDLAETSTAEGRPYFLYLFAEGSSAWRFTSRANAWTSPAGAIGDEAEDLVWEPSAVSHGSVVQSSDPRRVDLSVTFPLSDPFARRYLGPRGRSVTTLTIFRGHEQVPAEVVAHWKGRIVSARVEGRRITLRAESLFTSMRREGVRAKYQRLCRHALYSRGCRLDIETFFVGGTATARSGLEITVAEAALLPDGWFRGGVLRHAGLLGFITGHVGDRLTLAGRMPELETAIDDPEVVAVIDMAPGCDLRRDTCAAKFGNLLNFGGFTATGKPHIVSERLQFAAIDRNGAATNAGIAPHLNLRPARPEEIARVEDLLQADWLRTDLEKTAVRFATVELAQKHVAEVKARRIPEIDKVEQEVKARLKKEINYWDARAFELKEEERAGKKTRLNWQNAQRRAEELAERLKRRLEALDQERFISAQPPRVRGGMVVIPRGLLIARAPADELAETANGFSEDPVARRKIEIAAMEAVMAVERTLGNTPTDVSAQKVGYDIASYDPKADHLRFIEVKGRIDGADTVMITRQEVITSLHEPDKFILAVVQVENGFAREPRYVRGALDTREPPFEHNAIQFSIKSLLERAEVPR